jgi:hypothetical protein
VPDISWFRFLLDFGPFPVLMQGSGEKSVEVEEKIIYSSASASFISG